MQLICFVIGIILKKDIFLSMEYDRIKVINSFKMNHR